MERPSKRARLLSDGSASDSDGQEDNLATIKINDEYAKRFQHNKAREERHRLEEKYGETALEGPESDSDSESEDDEGLLATQELDAQIFATLQAIKSKDPRVYDKDSTFYKPDNSPAAAAENTAKPKEKPVFLRDYHRKNLLEGGSQDDPDSTAPLTYADEQSAAKRELLQQMHEASDEADEHDSDEDGFLVRKAGQTAEPAASKHIPKVEVEMADKDPETYLSNFMQSRAWLPSGTSRFEAFESDSEEDLDRAEAFEQAWNMRFEDPTRANEKLVSHSREAANKYSVRRDEPKGRKKAREVEKAQKDAEKLEREEEKARLRRLKVEEAQEKLQKFKEAAGLKRQAVPVEEWSKFLDAGWDSEKWDREMAKRFGEGYYAGEDDEHEDEAAPAALENSLKKKKKTKLAKKPKWEDDIDIADIVPDYIEEEDGNAKAFTLSDDDEIGSEGGVALSADPDSTELNPTSGKSSKSKKKDAEKLRMEQKRQARKERAKIEELVDQSLAADLPAPSGSSSTSKHTSRFRYRDTSPSAFGLSARDILMADDGQLNQFAGLKKLASFRDAEKKRRDKKKLGKKARLRQWRKETFGDEEGPKTAFEEFLNARRGASAMAASGFAADGQGGPEEEGRRGRRKKHSRRRTALEASI